MKFHKIITGDALESLKTLESGSVQCIITSPPYYGARDYNSTGQIGLEQSPDEYIIRLVEVFREARRALKDDGVLFVNLGDSYATSGGNIGKGGSEKQKRNAGANNIARDIVCGLPAKNLLMIPARVAIALQADGWYLRSEIVWAKGNPMPESVKDRPTKSHEMIYLLSKQPIYHFDTDAIKEPSVTFGSDKHSASTISKRIANRNQETSPHKNMMYDGQLPNSFHKNRAEGGADKQYEFRNKRDVWFVNTSPFRNKSSDGIQHFAVFPEKLIEPCVLAGSREGDIVLDPFSGSGTTGVVSKRFGRSYIGLEINPDYVKLSEKRIGGTNE